MLQVNIKLNPTWRDFYNDEVKEATKEELEEWLTGRLHMYASETIKHLSVPSIEVKTFVEKAPPVVLKEGECSRYQEFILNRLWKFRATYDFQFLDELEAFVKDNNKLYQTTIISE